jgi:hypothetical protein
MAIHTIIQLQFGGPIHGIITVDFMLDPEVALWSSVCLLIDIPVGIIVDLATDTQLLLAIMPIIIIAIRTVAMASTTAIAEIIL